MPVTAKLSRKFYDQFGDEIANELVEWFNSVDETYRSQLRELNELNFARFDAKMEQRIAELRGDLRAEIAGLGSDLRAEIAGLGSDLRGEIAGLGSDLRAEIAGLGGDLRDEMGGLKGGLRDEIAKQGDLLRAQIASLELRTTSGMLTQTRWMIGLWVAQVTVLIGTVLVVLRGP